MSLEAGPSSPTSLRSMPEQNTSPRASSRIARIPGSLSAASTSSTMAELSAGLRAFLLSGRFNVSRSTAPSRVTSTGDSLTAHFPPLQYPAQAEPHSESYLAHRFVRTLFPLPPVLHATGSLVL